MTKWYLFNMEKTRQERKTKIYLIYRKQYKYVSNHIKCKWFEYFGYYVLCCLIGFVFRLGLTA